MDEEREERDWALGGGGGGFLSSLLQSDATNRGLSD